MIQSCSRHLDTGKLKVRSIQKPFPYSDLTGKTGSELARLRGSSLNAWKIPSLVATSCTIPMDTLISECFW